MKSDRNGEQQYGALPWRLNDGKLEILLVTSRETKRWVIPKGWPMEEKSPAEAAETEAYEEAGIRGVTGEVLGVYPYNKLLKDGSSRVLNVEVFPMRVETELTFWPELAERRRRWFEPVAAANAVDEPELADMIRAFSP